MKSGTSHHAGPSSSRRLAARSTTQSLSPSSSSSRHRRRIQRPPRPLKVVLIGPGSVGKTSLRQTYFTNRFQHNYKATIGADFEAKVVEYEGRRYGSDSEGSSEDDEPAAGPSSRRRRALLTVWDTAGQERFRALGSAFYRGADAALVCFDASCEDEETVRKGIDEWYEEFAKHAGLQEEERKRFCWVAVGCKADLRGEGEGTVVPRRKVREWLDALMPRGPVPSGAGAAVVTGHGDRPPADPTEVLAREGRHAVDDEELSFAARGVEEAADPAEGDESSVRAGLNGEATVQDDQLSGDKTIGRPDDDDDDEAPRPFPSSSPPRTPPTERQRSSSGHATINGNRKNGNRKSNSHSAASTPPKTLHLPPPAQSSSAGSSVNGAPPASAAAISSRNRLDSTRSFASTATGTTQMSVYHTPRNSAFWNGSATSAATTSSSIATATGSPVRHRAANGKAGRERSLSGGSGSTTKMGANGSDAEEVEDQPRRAARLRRALTPSSTSTVVKKQNGLDVAPAATRSTSRQTLHGDPDEDQDHPSRPPHRRPLSTPSLESLAPPTAAATKAAPPAPPPLEGFSLFYTSSLDGTNVRAVFEHVVSRCARRWEWEDHKARAEASDDPTNSPGKSGRGTQRRKSKALAKRRSWWMGGGTTAGAQGTRDEDGFALETRRMVRLSDGKGDDSARLFGGCC